MGSGDLLRSSHSLPVMLQEFWYLAQPQLCLFLAMGPAALDPDPWNDIPPWSRIFLVTMDLPGRRLSYVRPCLPSSDPNSSYWVNSPSWPCTWLITIACLMIQTLSQSWLLSLDLPCSLILDNAGGSYHASCVVSLRFLVLMEQTALTTPWQHVGQAVVFKKWQIAITFQFTGLGVFFFSWQKHLKLESGKWVFNRSYSVSTMKLWEQLLHKSHYRGAHLSQLIEENC